MYSPPSMAQRKEMGYPQREAATPLEESPPVASIFGWHLWISVKRAESSSIPLSPSIRSSTNCGAISRICRAILLGRPTRPPKSTSQRTCVGKKYSKNPPRSQPPGAFGVALRPHFSPPPRHADPARVGHPDPRLARHPDVSHLAAPQAEEGLRRNTVRGRDGGCGEVFACFP